MLQGLQSQKEVSRMWCVEGKERSKARVGERLKSLSKAALSEGQGSTHEGKCERGNGDGKKMRLWVPRAGIRASFQECLRFERALMSSDLSGLCLE